MLKATNHQLAPGIHQWLPLPYGSLRRARRDPLRFYMEVAGKYGDVFRWHVGPFVLHLLSHPDHVKHVLQERQTNYRRGIFYKPVKLAVGDGLVTSEGDFWRRQRRLVQPAFHRQRLDPLAEIMTTATSEMLKRWEPYAKTGDPFNITRQMMRLTLSIAGLTLFHTDISGESDALGQGVTESIEYINYRLNNIAAPPLFVPTRRNLRFKRAVRTFDRIVYEMIAQRRQNSNGTDDLLSLLLSAADEESGERMSDRQLRDEIVTFVGAGHETTAVALTWTFYLLSQHPSAQRRLQTEVEQVLGERVPTVEDLHRLEHTKRVLLESMRLYPPVWGLSRDAVEDDEIGGFFIPAGSVVMLFQYITHRHPAFWENPEGFDPDRFLPDRAEGRPRYAYFPFSGGPHQCIGNEFALMEAQLVLAMVMQKYRLELLPGCRVEPDPIFTLRPKSAVLMTLHPSR